MEIERPLHIALKAMRIALAVVTATELIVSVGTSISKHLGKDPPEVHCKGSQNHNLLRTGSSEFQTSHRSSATLALTKDTV